MLWRAQSLRHSMHLLPGQTILEIGAGAGYFTQQLYAVTRGENPITAITFGSDERPRAMPAGVEHIDAQSWPDPLAGRTFDCIVAADLLDARNCASFLRNAFALLEPGGQLMLFESNPWNVVLRARRLARSLLRDKDPRHLLSRYRLYELMSQVGFVGILAVYNDFVYRPLTRRLVWLLRNLSIILENTPGIRSLAGTVLIHGRKPGEKRRLAVRGAMCEHASLVNAVSVVVPCHNEEMNVRPLVASIMDLYGDYIRDLVLVDDNSSDRTADVILQLAREMGQVTPVIRKPPNGVGRAISDGLRAANAPWVLSMDCDFTHLLPEFRDLFDAAVAGYDVVVGSRFSRQSVLLNYPLPKIFANRGFHLIANIVLRRKFRDVTNNLKIMRREVVDNLRLQEPGFAVNAETGLQPLLMGYSVREVAISWIDRTTDMGTSSFRLAKVGGGYWRVLARLARQTRFGSRSLDRPGSGGP
jgi:dolichol-phosphate mannosyltransferase